MTVRIQYSGMKHPGVGAQWFARLFDRNDAYKQDLRQFHLLRQVIEHRRHATQMARFRMRKQP